MPSIYFSCNICKKVYKTLLRALVCEMGGRPKHVYPIGTMYHMPEYPEKIHTILDQRIKKRETYSLLFCSQPLWKKTCKRPSGFNKRD